MEYLLVMALSGSTMTCLYLLARRILRDKLSASAFYLIAKAAVLYYLIPLPFLKIWYHDVVPRSIWENRKEPIRIPLVLKNHTVFASEGMRVNTYVVIQTVAVIVWLSGAFVRLLRQLIMYLRSIRWFAGYAEMEMTEQERTFVESLRKEYGVRRRVSLIPAKNGEATITFGILKPVIICGRETESREAALLARHEMVHIKRLDVLWKILVEFAMLLHWWNPILRKLGSDLETVCEFSCDELAMREKPEDGIKEYLRLMIEEAREKKQENASLKWKKNFGSGAEYIRERMDNLMKKNNRWNRYAAGALAAVLIFANSMTVFAYRNTVSDILPEDASQEEIEDAVNYTIFAFSSGEDEPVFAEDYDMRSNIEMLYEKQFIDEEGNIYPIHDDEGISFYCNHVYDSGRAQYHLPLSGGGCRVDEYYAQRCVKCDQVIRGAWICSQTWAKCPH